MVQNAYKGPEVGCRHRPYKHGVTKYLQMAEIESIEKMTHRGSGTLRFSGHCFEQVGINVSGLLKSMPSLGPTLHIIASQPLCFRFSRTRQDP